MGNIKHRTGAIGGGINLSKSKTPHDADIKYDPINDRADSLSPLNQSTSSTSADFKMPALNWDNIGISDPTKGAFGQTPDYFTPKPNNKEKEKGKGKENKGKKEENIEPSGYTAPENDAYWKYMMSDQVKVGAGESEDSQPLTQTGEISGKQLNKKNRILDLSNKHKNLKDAYDDGQKVNENRLFNVEKKLERKQDRYIKKYGNSPYSLIGKVISKKPKMGMSAIAKPLPKIKQ